MPASKKAKLLESACVRAMQRGGDTTIIFLLTRCKYTGLWEVYKHDTADHLPELLELFHICVGTGSFHEVVLCPVTKRWDNPLTLFQQKKAKFKFPLQNVRRGKRKASYPWR